jgi:hypothetical protein
MSDANFPRPPVGYTALRRQLRIGLSTQARQIWWPSLPRIADGDGINEFTNISELAGNRYKWANADRDLEPNASLEVKVLYVVQLLVNQYHLFDEELTMTLARMLVKELADISLAFSTLCDVMDRGPWFIAMDAAQHRIRFETLRLLVQKNNKNFYDSLLAINALDDQYLDIFFTKLFVDVLPEDSVKKLMDIFLYEGIKTIYRFSVSFLFLSSTTVNPDSFKSGDAYWAALLQNKTNKCPSFYDLCNFANDIGKGFLSKKCVPARATIGKMENAARIFLTAELGTALKAVLSHPYSETDEVTTTSNSKLVPLAHDLHLKSQLLDTEMSKTLQSYFEKSVNLEGFELMFATHADGWHLGTLYQRIEKLSPCVLLIQSTEGAVFGAFLSTEVTPSPNPKGDGRCFIFRLNGPNPVCHRWSSATPAGHTHASHHQYFVPAREFLSVGADTTTATSAIRLDESMAKCDCGTSDTYENRVSLVPEHIGMGDINVAEVEVLCGRASVLRSGKAPHIIAQKK